MGIGLNWIYAVLTNLAVLIGIWVIRDTVAGYDDLFNVFDDKIQQKLKLYKTMNRPSCQAQDDIRNLFKDSAAYSAFRNKVQRILFQRTELWALIFTSICFFVWMGYNFVFEQVPAPSGGIFPWAGLRVVLNIASEYFMTVFGTGAITLVFGYLGAVSLLGSSSGDLRIWSYIRYLCGESVTGSVFISYEAFHDKASTLGGYVYRITFRIVLLEVLSALAIILSSLLNQGTMTLSAWFFALSIIIASLFIFVTPLLSLHRVLAKAKEAILQVHEEEYEYLKVRFMSQLRELCTNQRARSPTKSPLDVATELNALQTILAETRRQRTWAFRPPMVLKVIGTSLIPITVAILETLLLPTIMTFLAVFFLQ